MELKDLESDSELMENYVWNKRKGNATSLGNRLWKGNSAENVNSLAVDKVRNESKFAEQSVPSISSDFT